MKILGIETSCDETAAAVVENGSKILSNIVATSTEMHEKTGGIIPEQAAREQVISIIPVIQEALKESKTISSSPTSSPRIDAIAVTIGPGLIGSLLVGVETAKTLALVWKKPLVPVNHLVGHIYANWFDTGKKDYQNTVLPEFPAIALVVSGGHTDLVLMKGHPSTSSGQAENLKWIGGTRDDAAGEAFDKTARLLGLPYPGGPSIDFEARKYLAQNPTIKLNLFPRPLIDNKGFDWSFSGLKTAVLREVNGKNLNTKEKQKLAAEVQEAITDVLVEKTLRAIKKYKPRSFLLAGGVAANQRLREKFSARIKTEKLQVFHVPPARLCTDNAAYIAAAAYHINSPIHWKKVDANPQLTIVGDT